MRQSVLIRVSAAVAVALAVITVLGIFVNNASTDRTDAAIARERASTEAAERVADVTAMLTDCVRVFVVTGEESALADCWEEAARDLVFGDAYAATTREIAVAMDAFREQLAARVAQDVSDGDTGRSLSEALTDVIALLSLVTLLTTLWFFHRRMGRVITRYAGQLHERDPHDLTFRLEPDGALELHELADAFNRQNSQTP